MILKAKKREVTGEVAGEVSVKAMAFKEKHEVKKPGVIVTYFVSVVKNEKEQWLWYSNITDTAYHSLTLNKQKASEFNTKERAIELIKTYLAYVYLDMGKTGQDNYKNNILYARNEKERVAEFYSFLTEVYEKATQEQKENYDTLVKTIKIEAKEVKINYFEPF